MKQFYENSNTAALLCFAFIDAVFIVCACFIMKQHENDMKKLREERINFYTKL